MWASLAPTASSRVGDCAHLGSLTTAVSIGCDSSRKCTAHAPAACAGLADCLSKTVKHGGIMSLYNGFGVSVQVQYDIIRVLHMVGQCNSPAVQRCQPPSPPDCATKEG